MTLDASQQAAVDNISTLHNRLNLLIGAGGSGKTYTIRHLLQKLWADDDNNITDATTYLAAPTGKAAKVLADSFAADGFAVENEPKTIHRMLEFVPGKGFMRCADNPLDATLVIIDEASMVDSELLARVVEALPEECYLILVGDENQLPPVGPGQPFSDLINHGRQEIINRLTTNHRQQKGSLIAHGCLAVLVGQSPMFGEQGKNTIGGELLDDLFFIEEEEKEEIPDKILKTVRPWHDQGYDYCILSPQHNGVIGVNNINTFLQEHLNPHKDGMGEVKIGFVTFRDGDKVKNIKNNYELNVFNGYNGTIISIDHSYPCIIVDFDGEHVEYSKEEHIRQLTLGYCSTIHSAQGSQYHYGVVLTHSSHWYQWNRSLFYTALSRFRNELFVVGDTRALKRAISNIVSGTRNTLIKLRLTGETT